MIMSLCCWVDLSLECTTALNDQPLATRVFTITELYRRHRSSLDIWIWVGFLQFLVTKTWWYKDEKMYFLLNFLNYCIWFHASSLIYKLFILTPKTQAFLYRLTCLVFNGPTQISSQTKYNNCQQSVIFPPLAQWMQEIGTSSLATVQRKSVIDNGWIDGWMVISLTEKIDFQSDV